MNIVYIVNISKRENLQGEKQMKKMYMNLKTGSVDDYEGWYYENEEGKMVNAVDLNEVIEVEWNEKIGTWVETWATKGE